MSQPLKLTIFGALFLAGLCALLFVVSLPGQTLDRAEKVISLVGALVAMVTSVLGLMLQRATPPREPDTGATRPLSVTGLAGVAVGGNVGGDVSTEVSGMEASPYAVSPGTDAAAAPGSALVKGNVTGSVRIKVDGRDQGAAS
ncbi:hypothetical protein SAMN06272781_5464 [Streptomyces sp. 1222.2]|uniref:hypothetical protein n=2 Tax=unclassified Streptomyces TaxID=2593676 RepID=UPI000BD222A2|nr:hypothetical protein [Streptomyces sp. 1222.2]SOD77576.1 hypothetical protein SAMN06272781_5464 [Streptomyces sp. 1222.2]